MPKITQTNKGGVIKWGAEDWLAGLHPQYSNATTPSRKLGNYLGTATSMDPYRNLGWATPGYVGTALANNSVIDATQVNLVINATFGYTIGGTKVHQVTISSGTITTPVTFPRTIVGATEGQDVIVYAIKNGSTARPKRLLYSWRDSTIGNIGIYDFVTTFTDSWMSTVPTGAAAFDTANPHIFKIGSDDILYATDGNNIHAIDGTGGTAAATQTTLTKNVLTLPEGYIATGMARIEPSTLVIFAYKDSSTLFYKGQVTAFFWDYLSLDPYKVVDISDNYVSAPFEFENTIGCFTQGQPLDKMDNAKTGKLWLWNGSIFELKGATQDKADGIPATVAVGGVDVVGKQIMWNTNGSIYSYGNNFGFPPVLNKIAEATGTAGGLLKTVSALSQYSSSGTTTSGGLESLNTNYNDNSILATSLAEPNFPIRFNGQVKRVRVAFKANTTPGRGIDVILVDEAGNESTILSNLQTITAGKLIYERELTSAGAPLPVFSGLKAVLDWGTGINATDAPVVEYIEVEYENKNIVVV